MTIPEMKHVKSSNVEAVGYHPESSTLHVKFRGGSHYTYAGVSPQQHTDLVGAESVGKHLNQNIIGKFAHTKLETT